MMLKQGTAVALLAVFLAGCEGANRLSDFGRSSASSTTQPRSPRQQTFTPAPTTRVESSTLPPVSSAPTALPSPGASASAGSAALPPVGSSVPIDPLSQRAVSPPPAEDARPVERSTVRPPAEEERPVQTAARPDPAPRQETAPTRTSVTGNWSAKEASGGACKVTLSGTPTLDLYKASSAGCKTREMQRVTAWELRGEEIYLYETGGAIAARLRKTGSSYEGASAKTGAPIALSK